MDIEGLVDSIFLGGEKVRNLFLNRLWYVCYNLGGNTYGEGIFLWLY